jgi:transcriptional regulator with XRE-family HTH domain
VPRLRKKFTNADLRKARAAAYRYTKYSDIADFLGVDTKTLWRYRQNKQFADALKAGRLRRWRQDLRALDIDPDATEADFKELDAMLDDDFKPLEEKPGYIIEHEIIHYPDGSTREIWTQIPEPLPSLKELQKGMRRINGVYQF